MNSYTKFQQNLVLNHIITSPEDDLLIFNNSAKLDTTGFVLTYCKTSIPQKYITYATDNYKKVIHSDMDYFQLFLLNDYQTTIPNEFQIFTRKYYKPNSSHPFILYITRSSTNQQSIEHAPQIIRSILIRTINYSNMFYDEVSITTIL